MEGFGLSGPYTFKAAKAVLMPAVTKSGVYVIQPVDGSLTYVGSSKDVRRRLNEHFSELHRGVHPKAALQTEYKRSPKFVVFLRITETREEAYDIEQQMLDQLGELDGFLNSSIDARNPCVYPEGFVHPNVGQKRDPEMMAAARAKWVGLYTGENSKNYGRKHSDETRAKLSDISKARPVSEEKMTAMREARKGKPNPKAKSIIIDSVHYLSAGHASIELGIPTATIYSRVTSSNPRFESWAFAQEGG